MQTDHLINKGSHFELVIYKSRGNKPKMREVIPIYPTAIPRRPSIFRTVDNLEVSISQVSGKTPSVLPAETATSDKVKKFRDYWNKVRNNLSVKNPQPTMPVSSTSPNQSPVSNPPKEASDEF